MLYSYLSAGRRRLGRAARALALALPTGAALAGGALVAAPAPAGAPAAQPVAASYTVVPTPFPAFAFGARRVFIDADADGDQDVLYQTGTADREGIAYGQNNGYGTFTTVAANAGGTFSSGPFAGATFTRIVPNTYQFVTDLNKDGRPDLVDAADGATGRVFYGIGGRLSVQSSPLPTLPYAARRVFVDVDRDGDVDMLYQTTTFNPTTNQLDIRARQGIYLVLNTTPAAGGNASFGTPLAANTSGTFTSGRLNGLSFRFVATNTYQFVVDIDTDGDPDLVQVENGTAGSVLLNGTSGFSVAAANPFPQMGYAARRVFLDVDADGDQDMLYQQTLTAYQAGTAATAGEGVTLLLNNGTGTFAAALAANASGTFGSGPLSGMTIPQVIPDDVLFPVDFDRDGDTDLVETTQNGAGRVLRQNGGEPVLVSTSPATGATGVSPFAPLTLTFDVAVTKGLGNLYLVRVANNEVVETTSVADDRVSGSGTTYTYTPAVALAAGTQYALRTDADIFAAATGRRFAGILDNTTLRFTTLPATTITGIVRELPSPATLAAVSYRVTFADAVGPLVPANFRVTTTGALSGAGVTSVTAVAGSRTTYTVVVNTGTGNGTVRLELNNSTGVVPPVSNVPFAGEEYRIIKSFTTPVVRLAGVGNGNGDDVTAFVDQVQLLRNGTGTAVSGALRNPSFETYDPLTFVTYGYRPTGASWTFESNAGIARNGTGFNPPVPAPADGEAVAFLQSAGSDNGALEQALTAPVGVFQLRFLAAQRAYNGLNQTLNVYVRDGAGGPDVFAGTATPITPTAYESFTTAAFTVTATAPTDITLSNSTLAENVAANTPVGTLSTTSATPGETFTYTLVSGTGDADNAAFNISGNALRFTASPDFETKSSYTVRVRTATSSNASLTYEEAFTITITDANEAPVLSAQAFAVAENAANGTVVGTVAASDVDAGQTLTYAITGENPGGAFAINSGTGQLTVATAAALNFEATPSLPVDVTVTDNASPALSATARITVSVTNVNEAPVAGNDAVTVNEDSGANTLVSVRTNDSDPDGTTPTLLSVTQPAAGGSVTITGTPPNRLVQFTPAADFFGTTSFTYTIWDGSLTATATVTVTVRAVNDAPVVTARTFSVAENSAAATVVGTATATDVDGPALTYSLTAGNTGGAFALDATTGALTVANPAALDYETRPTFTLTVAASDGSLSGSNTITVNLTDVDDTAPAAPVVTAPTASQLLRDRTPTYAGTAEAGSTVVVTLNGTTIGSATTIGGSFSLTQPTALADGTYVVRATATDAASNTSALSAPVTFTLDATAPTVVVSSPAANPTSATPIPVEVTFSEAVSSFSLADVQVSGGTAGNLTGSGQSYTFNLTPAANGTLTVSVVAGAAQDAAGNPSLASAPFGIEYAAPVSAVTWDGSASTDWNTAANWTPAVVPTSVLNVTIPAGAPRYPVLGAGPASAHDLTLASGGSLSLGSGMLRLAGNFASNGTLNPGTGTLELMGNTRQTLGGSAVVVFYNLNVGDAGATLSGPASVQNVLTLNGSLTTNEQTFTLTSTPALTAMVVNNGGTVLGQATVQRAIDNTLNKGLGYRHYSSPVAATTVADLATPGFVPVVNRDYNSAAEPGLVRPFPTVLAYDQDRLATVPANRYALFDRGWFSPAPAEPAPKDALSAPLLSGRGYSVNLNANQVVDFVGTLGNDNQPPLTLARNQDATAPAAGWHLLGNPYPAPIDWNLITTEDRPNVDGAMYVFESTSQYAGRYRSYVNEVGDGSPLIAVGQGFFVRVAEDQASGRFTFRQEHRLTSPAATTLRRGTRETRPLVQLQLQGATGPTDAAYVYFQAGATAGVDAQFDAVKMPNSTGLNLSATTAKGQALSIQGLPPTELSTTLVPLAVRVPATGSYTLHAAQLLNLPTGTQAYLRDQQTGTVVNLSQQPSYAFTMNAAFTGARFELFFSPATALASGPASLAAQVAVFPNPARTTAFVELPAPLSRQPATAVLLDGLGRSVRSYPLPAGVATHQLSLAEIASGVYTLRFLTPQGTVNKKLVVE